MSKKIIEQGTLVFSPDELDTIVFNAVNDDLKKRDYDLSKVEINKAFWFMRTIDGKLELEVDYKVLED